MTEEKKTTTRKTTAKKTENKPKTPAKPKIDKDTEVLVYNNTSGRLVSSAKKGNGYLEFSEPMDSDVMTVEELQQMRNGHRKVLEDGWIYVDDEDVLDYLRLGKLKDKVKNPETLKNLIESGDHKKIVEVVETVGESSKKMLYQFMRDAYNSGNFGNAHTIKDVEKILGTKDSLLDD